jgi:hypothetical protein
MEKMAPPAWARGDHTPLPYRSMKGFALSLSVCRRASLETLDGRSVHIVCGSKAPRTHRRASADLRRRQVLGAGKARHEVTQSDPHST